MDVPKLQQEDTDDLRLSRIHCAECGDALAVIRANKNFVPDGLFHIWRCTACSEKTGKPEDYRVIGNNIDLAGAIKGTRKS